MKTINSFRSKLFALTFTLMASVASFAYEFEYVNDFHIDGFAYKIIDRTEPCAVALIEVADCEKHVAIPESVIYNDTTFIVTTMGMGNIVFSGIAQKTMESLYIPKTIMIINYRALGACPNLMSIVVDEENKYLDSRNNCNAVISSNDTYRPANQLVAGCKTTVIPNSVTEIGNYAFVRCETLENIIIPEGVTTIRDGAFYECTSLSSIKLPESLTQLTQQWIFGGCTSLKEVFFFAKTPPYIAYGMFIGITPTIYVPEESLDAYKKALYWQNFDIQAIPYKDQWCDTWNVMWFDGLFFDETASTSQYRLGKDTVIGNYTYSKFTSRTSVRFTNDRKVYVYYEGFDDNDPYSEDLPTGEYLAYDFSAQVGDTLEVFSGVTYNTKTYKCVVYDVQTDPETNLRTIMLHPLRVVDGNGNVEVSSEEITWIEGVGSPRGFLIGTTLPGGGLYTLLCAYKGDELKYTGSLYDEYGCEYNATEQNPADLFPTLWGLQRTSLTVKMCPTLFSAKTDVRYIKNKAYLDFHGYFLREENNQVLVYSGLQEEDLVLYDYSLEVGDTLTTLNYDYRIEGVPLTDLVVDYPIPDPYGSYDPIDTLIVTNILYVTLLDGKEYKQWTFNNGMQYVEGIGQFGQSIWAGDFFALIRKPNGFTWPDTRDYLVCASRNGQLLYQMDDAEMERLGAECLCEVEKKWSDTWCDTWNIMEHNVQLIGDYNEETWRHYLAEDTTINGTTYTTVNRYWTADKTKRGFVATIRFTEDQKVYALLGDTEYLVYDFSVQVGDTIETIVGVNCGTMLQRLLVHQVDIDDATNRKTITLYPLCKLEEDVDCDRCDENGYYLDLFPIQWIEGVGSTDGFLMGDRPCSDWVGGIGHKLLCAYKDDELQYINDLYQDDYGCEYNAVEQNPENLFPTLWGLQRTVCNEYCGETEDDNSDNITYKQTFDSIFFENDKPYILCNGYLLREEDNKIFLYSQSLNKDIVLYDFTLEVGDSLPAYIKDFDGTMYSDDTLVVTDISSVTLLDGKEYKKWTFDNGMEYVEGIGMYGGHRNGNFFGLIQEIVVPCHTGTHLVCLSKNGKLLYMMDDAEMERLGTECLCEVEKKWSDIWCDTWNVLDLKYRTIKYTTKEDFETWRYYLAQDTIINNYTYTAVTRQTTKVPEGVYPFTIPEPEYVAAVRFTDDRKVYIYYDNTEYLLYDFNVQPGDELTVFAGINHYHSHHTNTIRVDEVERYPGIYPFGTEISLSVFPDFSGDVRPTCFGVTKWVEGVGDLCGFITGADCGLSEYQTALLCAYKDGNTEYTTENEEYAEYGCEYNSGENKEYILTLSGLQRTGCTKTIGENENGTVWGSRSYLMQEIETATIGGKQYLLFGTNNIYDEYCSLWLREENNKILLYSTAQKKDLVLYDFTLNVGDSLPRLYVDYDLSSVVDYDNDEWELSPLVVTEVSTITLLDGKEYKKWTFDNGMQYVEGIGSFGTCYAHNDFYQLIVNAPLYSNVHSQHLVCASKNGKLLYQMDDTEMEQMETECLCEYNAEQKPKDLFPTLWGLQRTDIEEHTTCDGKPYLSDFEEYVTTQMNGKLYLSDGRNYLREENNQVLFCCPDFEIYEDIVLYDWTLEIGDTLPHNKSTVHAESDFIVKNVSTVTLLDGKKYKKWTLACGYEYIEGIGAINGEGYGHYLCLESWVQPGTYIRTCLVCASRDGQLLYKMDDTEMERLGAECLCEIEPKWSETWCNQWNILSHGYQGPQDPLAAARTSIFWLSNNTVNRDGQEYIPLMCSSSLPNEESTHLVGELRFTEDKQVYFYYAFDETEYLLYDFGAELGDTLELFAGLEFYNYHKTYTHVITDKETLDDGRLQIQADVVIRIDNGAGEYFEEKHPVTWIEGLGSTYGIIFNPSNPGVAGDGAIIMLCAYREDECVYTTNFSDYKNMGCVYNNDGTVDEDLFPMLSGLQRTICNEYCEDSKTSLQKFEDILFEHDQPYIYCESAFLIREENNKILIYSHSLDKDLVLYDFTLEVGDSLPRLYLDESAEKDLYWIYYNIMNVVDYHKDLEGNILPADTLIVTDVSAITLLDGKEYKKWTFNNGMEYVEGIGSFGNNMRFFDFFQLIGNMAVPVSLHGTHLVCVSKNNKLLYQMDDAEMERLGAECLCDYDSGHRKDNAKDGQIGGRPTPTQWNQLEVVLREMDNNHTILQAETFSYTLEDISQQVNNKTYFQLARQSTKDTATTKSVVGALHFGKDEDNRVYFLRDGVEYVLYDFTAEPGDTVEIFAGINNYPQETTYTHVVTGKDTLENGACRMLLEVVFPDETNTTAENAEKVWLAGLGSVDGIVHNAAKRTSNAHAAPNRSADSNETETSVMLCAWREDSCLYTTDHPDYDSFGCVYNQDPTSVENTYSPLPMTNCQKIIRNEQLLILHEGKTYNVLGVQIK